MLARRVSWPYTRDSVRTMPTSPRPVFALRAPASERGWADQSGRFHKPSTEKLLVPGVIQASAGRRRSGGCIHVHCFSWAANVGRAPLSCHNILRNWH